MKKLLIIASILALTAAACNKTQTNNDTNNNSGNSGLDQTQTQNSNLQTYTNSTYGFEFSYPTTMKFVTPTYANLQDKVVQVQIGQDQYPQTNFGDAAVSVSSQFASSLANCLKLSPPENGDGFKTKVTINGVDFYMTKSTGVGAGNIYDSNIYRTVKSTGGACIEINETIHTSNIANYPQGTVTEVNKDDVQAKLDQVLQSFKFTN